MLRKLKRGDKRRFRFVDHHKGDGAAMLEAACAIKLEGIVSKRADAAYQAGDRSGLWTKAKCRPSQELIVVAGKQPVPPSDRSSSALTLADNWFTSVRSAPALTAAIFPPCSKL